MEAVLIQWKPDEYSKQDSGGKADMFSLDLIPLAKTYIVLYIFFFSMYDCHIRAVCDVRWCQDFARRTLMSAVLSQPGVVSSCRCEHIILQTFFLGGGSRQAGAACLPLALHSIPPLLPSLLPSSLLSACHLRECEAAAKNIPAAFCLINTTPTTSPGSSACYRATSFAILRVICLGLM